MSVCLSTSHLIKTGYTVISLCLSVLQDTPCLAVSCRVLSFKTRLSGFGAGGVGGVEGKENQGCALDLRSCTQQQLHSSCISHQCLSVCVSLLSYVCVCARARAHVCVLCACTCVRKCVCVCVRVLYVCVGAFACLTVVSVRWCV